VGGGFGTATLAIILHEKLPKMKKKENRIKKQSGKNHVGSPTQKWKAARDTYADGGYYEGDEDYGYGWGSVFKESEGRFSKTEIKKNSIKKRLATMGDGRGGGGKLPKTSLGWVHS